MENLVEHLNICYRSYSLNYNAVILSGMNFKTQSMILHGWDLGFSEEAFQGSLSMKVKGG